jgi:hypothetical protein
MYPVADFVLFVTSLAAMFYCRTLAKRLDNLKRMDGGVGAAISALSQQVDSMQDALSATRKFSGAAADNLGEMTARAEIAAGRLEILLANVHQNPAREKPSERRTESESEGRLAPLRLQWQNRIRTSQQAENLFQPDRADPRIDLPPETGALIAALKEALNTRHPSAEVPQ